MSSRRTSKNKASKRKSSRKTSRRKTSRRKISRRKISRRKTKLSRKEIQDIKTSAQNYINYIKKNDLNLKHVTPFGVFTGKQILNMPLDKIQKMVIIMKLADSK